MENARHISIDPYIDDGGILGGEIELNSNISEKIMVNTGLVRDVFIFRGSPESTSYNPQGTDELTLAQTKSVFGSGGVKKVTALSSIEETPTNWRIRLHDQEIHGDVDKWMGKKYRKGPRAGTDVYKEAFVGRINKEIASKISSASSSEKNDRFKFNLEAALRIDGFGAMGIGLVSSNLWFGINNIQELLKNGLEIDGLVNAGLLSINVIAGFAGAIVLGAVNKASDLYVDKNFLARWECFVPNPQLRARLRSANVLQQYGGKLVQLRRGEEELVF